MKLENAEDMIAKAEFKKFPAKVLLNVRINNLDTDSRNEITTKYEDCIEILKSKML